MNTYYVATLAQYVLVEAENEGQARERGATELQNLLAREGRSTNPINIRTIQPATADEIELQTWHDKNLAREQV